MKLIFYLPTFFVRICRIIIFLFIIVLIIYCCYFCFYMYHLSLMQYFKCEHAKNVKRGCGRRSKTMECKMINLFISASYTMDNMMAKYRMEIEKRLKRESSKKHEKGLRLTLNAKNYLREIMHVSLNIHMYKHTCVCTHIHIHAHAYKCTNKGNQSLSV